MENNIEKEFVSYEIAAALKELGFDEPCLAVKHRDGTLCSIPSFTKDAQIEGFNTITNSECIWENDKDSIGGIQEVATPLKQQVFRWFRDIKLSDSCICRYQHIDDGGIYYYYVINHDYGVKEIRHYEERFYSYEEAENACIDKLIELAKQQDNGRHN